MAMDWQACRKTLSDLIDQELALANELAIALAGEQDALRQSDPVALDAATLNKQSCVANLARLDNERQAVCQSFGAPAPGKANGDGLEDLLRRADPEGALTQRWRTLLTRLESCREANEKNGVVLRLQKRRVTEALGILQGITANNAVYGDHGELDETSGNHVHAEI